MSVKRQFIRKAVLRMHEQGTTPRVISEQSGVPLTTVRRWIVQSDPDYHERNLARAEAQKEQKKRDMLAVVALTHQGRPPKGIAESLGMNVRRVHRLLYQHRRNTPEAERPSPRESLRAQISSLRRHGLSMRTIADITDKSLGAPSITTSPGWDCTDGSIRPRHVRVR